MTYLYVFPSTLPLKVSCNNRVLENQRKCHTHSLQFTFSLPETCLQSILHIRIAYVVDFSILTWRYSYIEMSLNEKNDFGILIFYAYREVFLQ